MTITNAVLAAQVSDLVSKDVSIRYEYAEWLAGLPNGGPAGDGKYPLTDYLGNTFLVSCPSALAETVDGPASSISAIEQSVITYAAQVADDVTTIQGNTATCLAAEIATEADRVAVTNDLSTVQTLRADTLAFRNTASGAATTATTSEATVSSLATNLLAQANYQLWLTLGNVGTEADYLSTLTEHDDVIDLVVLFNNNLI